MRYRSRRYPVLRDRPLPPAPPLELARAPRHWLTRGAGECAFPVDGDGWTTRACCNPCDGPAYCPAHREASRGPDAPGFEDLLRELRDFL